MDFGVGYAIQIGVPVQHQSCAVSWVSPLYVSFNSTSASQVSVV